ncbi:transposase [Brevibacterium zhoupengii]|uniref:transposase n=1 Tax=Brevibacterium zhoupengii TaxID=2898795 RepID=UPI00374DE19A
MFEQFGIGIDPAAETLIVAGDKPERIKCEASFAKLAGLRPIPPGSETTSGENQTNHSGRKLGILSCGADSRVSQEQRFPD